MKRVLILAISLCVITSITMTYSVNSRPENYIIKFATVAPEGTTWMNVMGELNKSIMEKSGNRMKFQIYSGGVSGDEKDVIRKMRLGMLHSAGFTGNGLGVILPEIRVLEIPFLFENSDEVDYVVDKLDGYFSQAFESKGFILLGWAEVGFVNVFTNSTIQRLNDFKSVKMWSWEGDPLAAETFQACGITPIPLSLENVLTALQTGMVNGVYSSPLGAVSLQWFTKVKFMINPPMTNATGAVLITKQMYNKLPTDLQKILNEESKKYLRKLVLLSRKDNQESINVLTKSGIKIVSVSSEGDKEFRAVGEKVSKMLIGKLYTRDLLDRTVQALQEFKNSKINKASK